MVDKSVHVYIKGTKCPPSFVLWVLMNRRGEYMYHELKLVHQYNQSQTNGENCYTVGCSVQNCLHNNFR